MSMFIRMRTPEGYATAGEYPGQPNKWQITLPWREPIELSGNLRMVRARMRLEIARHEKQK